MNGPDVDVNELLRQDMTDMKGDIINREHHILNAITVKVELSVESHYWVQGRSGQYLATAYPAMM